MIARRGFSWPVSVHVGATEMGAAVALVRTRAIPTAT